MRDLKRLVKIGSTITIMLSPFILFGPLAGTLIYLFFSLAVYILANLPIKKRVPKELEMVDLSKPLKDLNKPIEEPIITEVKPEEIEPFFQTEKIHQLFTEEQPEQKVDNQWKSEELSTKEVKSEEIAPFFPAERIQQLFTEKEPQNKADHQWKSEDIKTAGPTIDFQEPRTELQEKIKQREVGSLEALHDTSTQGSEDHEKWSLQSVDEERTRLLTKFQRFYELEGKLNNLEASLKGSQENVYSLSEISQMRKEMADIHQQIQQFNQAFVEQKLRSVLTGLNPSKARLSSDLFAKPGDKITEDSRGVYQGPYLSRSTLEFGEEVSHRIDRLMYNMYAQCSRLLTQSTAPP